MPHLGFKPKPGLSKFFRRDLSRPFGRPADDGEALRDDTNFSYSAAWEFKGVDVEPELHKEPLEFEYAHPSTRSYK